ncbi:Sma protein [Toxoplasma gondii MAS]|uniref:Sma protein n=1 Tax=Toxoplasma gondii MAS TaxID=943118 RepID=A0A086PLB5_TOXGO|nr:Sma protein [Toxoplasma gondii MAS]
MARERRGNQRQSRPNKYAGKANDSSELWGVPDSRKKEEEEDDDEEEPNVTEDDKAVRLFDFDAQGKKISDRVVSFRLTQLTFMTKRCCLPGCSDAFTTASRLMSSSKQRQCRVYDSPSVSSYEVQTPSVFASVAHRRPHSSLSRTGRTKRREQPNSTALRRQPVQQARRATREQ